MGKSIKDRKQIVRARRQRGRVASTARREAAISFMLDMDGTGAGSLMLSVLSTLLKLQSGDV